jgi:hypothetical protein
MAILICRFHHLLQKLISGDNWFARLQVSLHCHDVLQVKTIFELAGPQHRVEMVEIRYIAFVPKHLLTNVQQTDKVKTVVFANLAKFEHNLLIWSHPFQVEAWIIIEFSDGLLPTTRQLGGTIHVDFRPTTSAVQSQTLAHRRGDETGGNQYDPYGRTIWCKTPFSL